MALRSGMAVAEARRLTLAADTISIAVGFAVAFVVTFPVNRWLIVRGRGHALAHRSH